jgi:ERCC4-related helicase
MTWPVGFDRDRISLLPRRSERISEADAQRQAATVSEILKRLKRQPGLVLADEVGMGKTFVAIAVAVSVAWGEKRRRPVVVMVPPSLREKWPKEFEVFRSECLLRERDRDRDALRVRRADSGVEFFKLLDDPLSRRAHIILVTHGALYRSLGDPWTKLAILKRGLASSRFTRHREVFHRFAADTVELRGKYRNEKMLEELLRRHPRDWRKIITKHAQDPGDDPVPEAITKVLKKGRVDLGELRQCLEHLPLKRSVYVDERIRDLRRSLKAAFRDVWREALVNARFRSPLLILDEAHHLKNPATRLASLFVEPVAEEEWRSIEGALAGRFERMLFLTATPFQLGHNELLNVLDRFRGIDWQRRNPSMTADEFRDELDELHKALDDAHLAASHLDQRWGRLRKEDVLIDAAGDGDLEEWWRRVVSAHDGNTDRVGEVLRAYECAREVMSEAERRLKPWVIRHRRPRQLSNNRPRRQDLPGAAVKPDNESDRAGLTIGEEVVLPFLLAARSQAALAAETRRGYSSSAWTFADGLASSYEAFLQTRASALDRGDTKTAVDEAELSESSPLSEATRWYLQKLAEALPGDGAYGRHPKISATVARVLRLWELGEKALVFCHWRATSRALQRHISIALDQYLNDLAARSLGCKPKQVDRLLDNLGQRFDPDRPVRRSLDAAVREILAPHSVLSEQERESILTVVRRFVRTPSFLLRYFPLEHPDSPVAIDEALQRSDASGVTLLAKLENFVQFLAERCTETERQLYLDSLDRIQTGTRYARERSEESPSERYELVANVRLAYGGTKPEYRQQLLYAFNSPFFPEILVASSVLAEGVDLHLDCRYVIHHDLSWNPSTVEQRTGRVDRIGAKAERVGEPINVFTPYIAGTQDEKMYRVVRDRERWFQVLMGENYAIDESATSHLESRVPLPEAAAAALAFKLHVYPMST